MASAGEGGCDLGLRALQEALRGGVWVVGFRSTRFNTGGVFFVVLFYFKIYLF